MNKHRKEEKRGKKMQDEKYILIQKQKELNEAIRVYRKDPKSFNESKRLIDATKVEDFDWNIKFKEYLKRLFRLDMI